VRVGVTTAKTLAQATGRPLVGVSSLDALAEPFAFLPAVVPVVWARRDVVIAGVYGSDAQPVAEPFLVPVADVVSRAGALLGDVPASLLLCGETAQACLPGPVAAATPAVAVRGTFVAAASVARLASRRLAAGGRDDPLRLAPCYVTPSPVG
jgi:tRNA threonylcarbamoyladenosine biosynthesis protein TsaB